MSVNFSCALFSFLDFLALEDGAYRLSRGVGKEECRSHMTIWPCRLRYDSAWSSSEWRSLARSASVLHKQIYEVPTSI